MPWRFFMPIYENDVGVTNLIVIVIFKKLDIGTSFWDNLMQEIGS